MTVWIVNLFAHRSGRFFSIPRPARKLKGWNMGDIYCLYSDQDGIPRYVGMTEGFADKRWKKHIASALDLANGELYDWIRGVVRQGNYVGVHVLQSGVVPADLPLFEGYWISQFPGLFNVRENTAPASELSGIARQVVLTIRAKLVGQVDGP